LRKFAVAGLAVRHLTLPSPVEREGRVRVKPSYAGYPLSSVLSRKGREKSYSLILPPGERRLLKTLIFA